MKVVVVPQPWSSPVDIVKITIVVEPKRLKAIIDADILTETLPSRASTTRAMLGSLFLDDERLLDYCIIYACRFSIEVMYSALYAIKAILCLTIHLQVSYRTYASGYFRVSRHFAPGVLGGVSVGPETGAGSGCQLSERL